MVSTKEAQIIKSLTKHPGWFILKRELQEAILRVVREQGDVVSAKTIERKGGESHGLIRALDLLHALESDTGTEDADG